MKTLREQFENLPEIAELLREAVFDVETGEYSSYWAYKSGYLNGAWYAYQEQQKKVDGVLDIACKHQYSNGERICNEIKELLK